MEIVKIGTTGTLDLELNIREKDKGNREIEWKDQILCILGAVNAGDIRLGARKTRGFGRLSVTEVWEKSFSRENVESWLEYTPGNTAGFIPVAVDKEGNQALFASIVFPLRLSGGISIRRYSARPGQTEMSALLFREAAGTARCDPEREKYYQILELGMSQIYCVNGSDM